MASFGRLCAVEREASPAADDRLLDLPHPRLLRAVILGSAAMNVSYWPFMIYLPIWFSAGLGL
jgi:hypothetical protein